MKDFLSPSKDGSGSVLRSLTNQESAQALKALDQLFDEIGEWQAKAEAPPSVHPNSPLGLANGLSAPFQAEHMVSYFRLAAIDHLHALSSLIRGANTQHILAPYSLIRAALESAATALWILTDENPRAIAVRSLRQEHANLRDLEKSYETLEAPEDSSLERRAAFEAAIREHGLQKEGIKGTPPGSLATIQRAAKSFQLGRDPVLMWQMCSGAAHGRQWITGFLTMMHAPDDDGESKVVSGQLVSNEQAIFMSAYVACNLVRRLSEVLRSRSAPPGQTGESFKPPTPLFLARPRLFIPR